MHRVALVAVVVGALPGCFYYESINQRPSVQIENLRDVPMKAGDPVMLRAVMDDPDGDFISLGWRVYACTDAKKFAEFPEAVSCDRDPFYEKSDVDVSFTLPAQRTFVAEGAQLSARSALVILDATDEYGATAKPRAELIIPIGNQPPTLELFKQSKYGTGNQFIAGTPVRVIAKVGDVDDGPERVMLSMWSADPPLATGFVASLVDGEPAIIMDPEDEGHWQHVKVFTANDPGEWTV
ncbi:MAG: hypothetical protein AB7L94_22515, partial [Kofleriaceae bacterium]